ncbi:MAG TPA: hypothetical protein VIS72_06925, partial [Anaerolineales bacterium]
MSLLVFHKQNGLSDDKSFCDGGYGDLVMVVFVLLSFADVFLRIFVKGSLAPQRTEIVDLALVLGLARGSGGIN